MTTIFHADDYGITVGQARSILALSDACGGRGALASVSMFANSPAFEASAALAAPHVRAGRLKSGLHVNLVEGRPCSDASAVPLLVDGRGAFSHAFGGLLSASLRPGGLRRAGLHAQMTREIRAQIERYLDAFPDQRRALRLDSHQHTHMIPLVFDAMLEAAGEAGCSLAHVRMPTEALGPYASCARLARSALTLNLVKDAVLGTLARVNRRKLPAGCATSTFCGIVLSGRMDRLDERLLSAFEARAHARSRDLEVLFHPVGVPVPECLDPDNAPFAAACASPARDAEAARLRTLRREG